MARMRQADAQKAAVLAAANAAAQRPAGPGILPHAPGAGVASVQAAQPPPAKRVKREDEADVQDVLAVRLLVDMPLPHYTRMP